MLPVLFLFEVKTIKIHLNLYNNVSSIETFLINKTLSNITPENNADKQQISNKVVKFGIESIYKYKVVISVLCPIITLEPLNRIASNFD